MVEEGEEVGVKEAIETILQEKREGGEALQLSPDLKFKGMPLDLRSWMRPFGIHKAILWPFVCVSLLMGTR